MESNNHFLERDNRLASKSGKYSPSSQFCRTAAGIILALTLPLCCLDAAGNQADTSESPNTSTAKSEPTVGQPANVQENPSDKSILSDEELEQEKRKLRLMLSTSIIILSGFFLAIFLISLLRIGQRYRRAHLSSRGKEPTELFDAWSNYRLDKDSINLDEPDDPNQKNKNL